MSLSTCEKCGGEMDLGPTASNRCKDCGDHLFGNSLATREDLETLRQRMLPKFKALAMDAYQMGLRSAEEANRTEMERLRSSVAALREMLHDLAEEGDTFRLACPSCGALSPGSDSLGNYEGHREGCALVSLLRSTKP